jgi:hypothetical protein
MNDLWIRVGDAIERGLQRLSRAPVRIALLVGFVAFFIGGIAFSVVEDDVSLIDGWYWATVVMPTVGFGDFAPATIPGRWVYITVVAAGWFTTILLGGALAGAITTSRLEQHTETPELDDDIDALKEHVTTELDRLKAITNDPRVKAALRETHDSRSTT